ncbi:cbb3-type cytochrome oxidase assembly protein CcoS [Novosphingobium piscinae]|uniref:Cbb3-type cytochrome oxidase assembly protein CcoS n=1 Tax=Novosphingobium piscinae TaxID=1507448 RepID=A0A7X1KRK3_9SPHN|nr:cbb3-type cytochrome oxidase assembly protein CcoS [Novosphingobium piscinae]MBC2670710.1 cbb3-type cytochrome oxidase assembly protein CcoS [Novosphingobium piscinae]
MTGLALLIPLALMMGLIGLVAFFWALRNGQFEDCDGAAARILIEDDQPSVPPVQP